MTPRQSDQQQETPMTLPLYQDHGLDAYDTCPTQGHPGLWFERCFNQYSTDWSVDSTGKQKFLKSLALTQQVGDKPALSQQVGDQAALEQQVHRLAYLAESLDGKTFFRQSNWHFATGLGNPHPVENGLSWHPLLGTPYLPGSAVKGLARAWLELNDYPGDIRRQIFGSDNKTPVAAQNGEDQPGMVKGGVIFFDALPLEPVSLTLDVITPHMGKWYKQDASKPDRVPGCADTLPADWHAPVPVPLLVAKHITLQFALAPRRQADAPLVEVAQQALEAALANLGAGAKTAVGYGGFVAFNEAKVEAQKQRFQQWKQEQQQRSQRWKQEQQELARQRALASMSEPQRRLLELQSRAEIPANQQAGSGADYHRDIAKALEEARDWPEKEDRQALAKFAGEFFEKHGSKQRLKQMKPLIGPLLS